MRRVLGEEHPDTVVCLCNLAGIYHHEQRHEEAGALEVQAIEACVKQLGWDNFQTLTMMGNIALSHWLAGRLEDAKKR
jgi:hypothetical protein